MTSVLSSYFIVSFCELDDLLMHKPILDYYFVLSKCFYKCNRFIHLDNIIFIHRICIRLNFQLLLHQTNIVHNFFDWFILIWCLISRYVTENFNTFNFIEKLLSMHVYYCFCHINKESTHRVFQNIWGCVLIPIWSLLFC